MLIESDPEFRRNALNALRAEYSTDEGRQGLHQSELVYCLTKSWRLRNEPLPATDKEVMLWSIGFGMERVLLSRELTPEPIVVDGISLSLDTLKLFGPADLKTTRMRAKGRKGSDGFELPQGWKRSFAAYRYGLNVQRETEGLEPEYTFGVICVHLIEPEVTAWQITFTPNELIDNWFWFLRRKANFERMLDTDSPEPFQHLEGEDWQCQHCQYSLTCQLQGSLERFDAS